MHRKIWNGSFDKHPALIARCAGVSDVIAAVKLGQESGLPVAVRSGGHSFPGLSVADDALMIDLSPMKGVRVDPEQRTARVQAGVLLGELDKETQAFGLAVPSGIVTHTGVAGLTLGGGIGWIMRKHGLSVDQLVSVDLVTAEGEFVKASADENADLFWGVRGGGGNFGIVTEFEFRCVPLGTQVLAGPMFWPMEQSGEVLRFYRDWVAEAPDELMTIVVHRKAPPLPFVPPELHGKPVVMVIRCWVGDIEEGEKFIRPLREFGSPVADVCVAEAVSRAPGDVRPELRAAALVLLQELRRRRADRRDHRHHRRALAADRVAADVVPDLADGRRGRAGSATTRPRSTAARRASRTTSARARRRAKASTRSASGCGASGRPWSPGTRACTSTSSVTRGRPRSPVLRAGEVRPAAGAEAEVRPGQLLPDQPEHLAGVSSLE